MKKTITLLALVAALGIVAMGCDPAPKDDSTPAAATTADAKSAAPDSPKTDK